jgi:iron complex outermembrane recepter protein
MGNNRNLQLAIRAALALATASAAAPFAEAQTAATTTSTDTAASSALEEVVVTGSRIQSTNLVSISPVTTVTAQDIAQTGLTRVEDILNNLPQVFAGQGSTIANGSDGTATVDLHDLGPQRTLVLVNGKRLGPGSADGRNFADINQIPAQLIEKVEVLTGGASATYGADAVSGVVNFILNTHFEGVKIDANYGMNQHSNHNDFLAGVVNAAGDGPLPSNVNSGVTKDLAVLIGSNFADGAGNATFYATYNDQAAVIQRPFDYSSCNLSGKKQVDGTTKVSCGGSQTSAGGLFIGYNGTGTTSVYNTVDPKTGQFRAFNNATDLYNFGAINFYQRPAERWTAGTFINYDVNPHANVYAELMFTRNSSIAQIGPGGDFGNAATISCANPLLTAQEVSVLCGAGNPQGAGVPPGSFQLAYILRRNVEGGGRQATFVNETYRTVLGVKGDFADAWKYDVSAQYSNTTIIQSNLNYFSNASIINALNVVAGPGGVPTCQSVIDGTDPNCVPWNIWTPGGVTKAALNYLNVPLTLTGAVQEYIVHADVSGDLGKYNIQLPTAKSGLQVNAGAEWREDEAHTDPDLESQLGAGSGGGGPIPPIAGEIHVAEVFTEFNLPIMDGIPGAEQLAFDGGYRYSSYNLGFKTNTFKLGLEWAPIRDVRFRGSYNRAVRAPDISELFTSQSVGPGGTVDPCWGATPILTAAQCELTGVGAPGTGQGSYGTIKVNSATQINTLSAGNPSLTPEKADTTSFGVVLQPSFLPGASASLDYYDIKIKNAILSTTAEGTAIILACAELGSPTACGLIHRSPGSNSLYLNANGFVDTTNSNVGALETKDVDLKMHYGMDIGSFGKLAYNLEGSYVISNTTQPFPGGPTFDCAGYWGTTCGNPLPKWRHTFSTDWATPWQGLDVNLRWRYLSSTRVDTQNSSVLLNSPSTDYAGFDRISNYSYIDASAAVDIVKGVTARIGVNNLLDKDPPTILSGNCPTGACNGNTFSQTYDVLGRFLYLHVTAQF